MCKVFRHFHEENTPDNLCKVLCTSELEVIAILSRFLPWFYSECPETIKLKMSTACTWIVDLKQQDDDNKSKKNSKRARVLLLGCYIDPTRNIDITTMTPTS